MTVKAQNEKGDWFELQAEGLLAICLQHELDHLVGKLFIDYLSPLKRDRIKKKLEKKLASQPVNQAGIILTTPLRIIFAGTPDFAARHLAALLDSPHQVIAVYSQPDRPAGRGHQLQQSPVKQLALQHDIPVYQPKSLKKAAAQQELAALNADLMVVVAYGLILPQAVLDAPRLGCINVHGSLLPRWRGAAPIQRAIWAGDAESGVTIMQMDIGLDTGAMLSKVSTPIAVDETSTSLYDKLALTGPVALVEALANLASTAGPGSATTG